MFLRIVFLLAISLLPVTISAQARVQADKRIAFTSKDAPWILTLALEGFTIDQQKQNQQGGRYFLMTNMATGVTASLFIEAAAKCKTAKECRDMVLKAGNPGWEDPTNLIKSEMPPASVFEFHMASFRGQPIRQQHLYAQFVEDGFWVDLHISKTLYEKTDHPLLENIVRSAKFESKTGVIVEAAVTAVNEWLALWDAGKLDEAYAKLSADSRKKMSKQIWSTHWTAVRKPLGNLKSRNLVETEYFISLPGVPEQDGYSIRFESSFDIVPRVTETLALMREKDGSWRVGYYISKYEPGNNAAE